MIQNDVQNRCAETETAATQANLNNVPNGHRSLLAMEAQSETSGFKVSKWYFPTDSPFSPTVLWHRLNHMARPYIQSRECG